MGASMNQSPSPSPIVAQKLTTLDNVLLPTCYYCCTKQNNTDNVQKSIFFPHTKRIILN